MEENKTCFNCKHFVRYYILNGQQHFSPINNGHCANSKVNRNIRKNRIDYDDYCDLWQPCELRKLARYYGIEKTLIRINETIEEIRQIISDE